MGINIDTNYLELKKHALEKYYSRMNNMQMQAVFHLDGPLLILAGAGSGKTTVLIGRIENMVRFGGAYHDDVMPKHVSQQDIQMLEQYVNGGEISPEQLADIVGVGQVKPWNILAITFTNKAAGELRARLEQKLGASAGDIAASTFHSMCVRILRRDISVLGYGSSFAIYDTDDSVRVIKDGLKACDIDEKILAPKVVLSAISRAKDTLIEPSDMIKDANGDFRVESIAKVYDYYQKTLKDANALDFDDIIVKTVRLFQQFPDVLAHYRNRYKYIMVDEYQDTNNAQYLLISLLSAGHKNLCVVGDDDQSIYKFRGATIENILNFENQFEDALVIRLEQNYRSTQNILDAANSLIENNTNRKGKNLWTDSGEGDKIITARLRDESEEGRLISDTILDNVKAGMKFSDHCVLYRMNAQSNSVEKALVKSGIAYRIVGGVRFYERKEIKDVMAYLSILGNPSDSLRLLRIINEPKRGIGGSTVTAVENVAIASGLDLYDVIATADQYPALTKKASPLKAFAEMLDRLREIAKTSALDVLLEALLEETGYVAALKLQGFEGIGRIENIMELKTNVLSYMQTATDPSLAQFLEETSLYTDLDNYDASADTVVLMTIHSAKGLEFENVFVAGMEEGIFPSKASMANPEDLEEERRLAYVAITRAKQRLTITSAERRLIFGQTVFGRPSRFIHELPETLMDIQDKTSIRHRSAGSKKEKFIPQVGTASSTTIGVGSAVGARESVDALHKGDRVEHKVFGVGKILSAKAMGNDVLLEIDFDTTGNKKVMANFARLIKL